MSSKNERVLPTTVIGSYAYPSWFLTSKKQIESGEYGITDIKETLDDAVNIAIHDQTKANIDIISDGEMRRWYFVQGFHNSFKGLEKEPILRKVGLYGYDSPQRWKATEKLTAPEGLGLVQEYEYLIKNTNKPVKIACPGPLTIGIHIRPNGIYKNRIDMAYDFAEIINKELKELEKRGANFIQIDEPSWAIIPGTADEWVNLLNSTIKGLKSKLALHVCFGNLGGRARGKRDYGWMIPQLLETNVDQLVFEYANREMKEIELWKEYNIEKELGAGVIDVKSWYVETPSDVADRINQLLKYTDLNKLYINPDCGFFQLPRWISYKKIENMVLGTQIIKKELNLI
tara:strand:+ start:428 stop:1459 length:1032 start_codon:yes stop_codon:yes gene_type:complete